MIFIKKLMILVCLMTFASCALMYEDRSFMDEMERETDGFFVPGRDFPVTPGDGGHAYRSQEEIQDRTPASFYSNEERMHYNSLKRELRKRENALSESEYKAYIQDKNYLATDSEKIYYLKLPWMQRREYLNAKRPNFGHQDNSTSRFNAASMSDQYSDNLPGLYERRMDINSGVYQGMKKREVMTSWGRPAQVDVAGDPRFQNERWSYSRGGKNQYVYFENGKVSGWMLED